MENGFMIVKNLVDVTGIFDYTKSIQTKGRMNDPQAKGAPSFYGDREMWKLQFKAMRKIEDVTGFKLYPTYNYFRIYNKNSYLKPHIDRNACEVSASINLGYDGDYIWDLWIEDKDGKPFCAHLEPGDALIYLGCERLHWRQDADDRVICQSQLFIHFVKQDGKNTNEILDWSITNRCKL